MLLDYTRIGWYRCVNWYKLHITRFERVFSYNIGCISYNIYFNFNEHTGNSLRWRHNGRDSVSNHQPRHCLLIYLFRRGSKKTSKLRVTGFCAGNSPGTGEFPAPMASYAENVSIWWRHHILIFQYKVSHLMNDGVDFRDGIRDDYFTCKSISGQLSVN